MPILFLPDMQNLQLFINLPEVTENKAAKMDVFLNAFPDESDVTSLSSKAINDYIRQ